MTGDLFGHAPATAPPKQGDVALVMTLHDQSPDGWLLASGIDRREAKWVPRSQCKRGEGRDENVWTMPIWLARDRGWM
ncbi:MAG: hypothetical protein ACREEY_15520 [Brevundimonas sp.]